MALNGKIAVVTGAALGIGKGLTEALLQNGAKVALLDVNEAAGRSLKEALDQQYGRDRTLCLRCDVVSEDQIYAALQKTIETFGGIDIVCNNAGILNEEEWEKTISINMVGAVKVTYLALEHMSKLRGGRGGVIINTASLAGLDPVLSAPVYTATKYGLIGFTRAMAAASAASGYGVRFNAVCPGMVPTDLSSNMLRRLGRFSHLADVTQQMANDSGVIQASQVAECVLELVNDETKNGEALMAKADGNKYVLFPVFSL